MRGRPDDAEKNPDAQLLEELSGMEARVRKMRENRNSLRDQGKAMAKKRNAVQDQYKEHREKLDGIKAELDAIHAERNMYKAKRDAVNAQLRDLFAQVKGRRGEDGEKKIRHSGILTTVEPNQQPRRAISNHIVQHQERKRDHGTYQTHEASRR